MTVTLTCPAGPLTEGDTIQCTLTIKNTGSKTLTNVHWWLPSLGREPVALTSGWSRDPPGELRSGRSVSMQLVYGPLSPRRGTAALTVTQSLGGGAANQPARLALPWPGPLSLTVIADNKETDAATVTHVVEVQALTAETLADDGEPTAQAQDEVGDEEATVAAPAPTATANENGVNDEGGVTDAGGANDAVGEEEILATVTTPPSRSPLQVELRTREEPVAVGQNAEYTLIVTNTSRYRLLTKLRWSSPTLGIHRIEVGDGTLRPSETVIMRLDYGPAHFRWQPAVLAAGRIYGIRDETVRLKPLTLPWPEPLSLMVSVDGKQRISEDEYRPVTTHASHVSALHAPPLTGQRASVGFVAARQVRAVAANTPVDVTFRDTLSPDTPTFRLLKALLGETAAPLPEIQVPAGAMADTSAIFTAYLAVAHRHRLSASRSVTQRQIWT